MVVHAALRGDRWHVTGCAIFGASLIVSNLSSTLYHAIAPPRAKRMFRVFDHLSIYFLVAGTYMPFVLVSLRGAWGWTLCGIVWGLAALGLTIKLTPLARVRGLSTGSYLAMGWTVLIAIKPVLADAKPWLTFAAAVAGIAVVVPHAAVAMTCHVHVPLRLEIYHPVRAAWTGTLGARPVTCCLATAVLPGPVDDVIIGRCQVKHFRGRRRLDVSNHNSVIGGTTCRQAYTGCCELNATAFP